MRYLFGLVIFSVLFMAGGCQEAPPAPLQPERPPSFYEQIRERDKNRAFVFDHSREIYKGSPPCAEISACVPLCNEIFTAPPARKDCASLSSAQVRRFDGIYSSLAEGNIKRFKKTRLSDLRVFLNISPAPVEKRFVKMGAERAKHIAYWIAEDWDTARLFYEEDENFLLLKALFTEIEFSVVSALRADIKNGASYYKIALEYGNESALSWIHGYFTGVCNNKEACLLSRYCLLNQFHYKSFSVEIFDYPAFSELVTRYMRGAPELKASIATAGRLDAVCSPFCDSALSENRC